MTATIVYTEEDIYGQVHPSETPEVIKKSLKELEAELDKLPAGDKEGWLQAKDKCPELTDDEHKLMFLRCEVFRTDSAATRLAGYWNKRIEIFGPNKAFQPLTLEGALKDDEVALSFGFMRLVVGGKDPSGRSIVYADPSRQDPSQYERESMLRSMWYIIHAALQDETTQQKGIIFLANPSKAKFSQFDRVQVQMNIESIKGYLPVRVSAFQICHPPTFFAIVFPIIKLFMDERLKKRVKVHAGSEEKVLKKLSKYGLDKDVLPSDLGGQISLDHKGWLLDRRDSGL